MLTIRHAKLGDEALVVEMINALARYERRSPDYVHITEEDVRRDSFGENPRFHTKLAFWDGKPVGYALYFFTYSSCCAAPILYLEDIFVTEELRGKSIGEKLLVRLAEIALEERCCRMEWHVLDWNIDAMGFYEAHGAKMDESVKKVKCDPAALRSMVA